MNSSALVVHLSIFITKTIFVSINIALVVLNLIASMAYWGITLNSVSVANCIISIGLAVDYSSHIAHAFLNAAFD